MLEPMGANTACSICSAPRPILDATNAALEKKTPLRLLEQQSGFSRAALSRHSRNCIARAVLQENAERKRILSGSGRVIVYWPAHAGQDAQFLDMRGQAVPPVEVTDSDCVLVVQYQRGEIKNPRALCRSDQERALFDARELAAKEVSVESPDPEPKPSN
jgi:hypothetical protein